MTSLKAVADPMLMRPMTQAIEEATMTASIGIAFLAWTLLQYRQPGSPRSRANAHTSRDAVAREEMVPARVITRRIAARTEAPALEPRAS